MVDLWFSQGEAVDELLHGTMSMSKPPVKFSLHSSPGFKNILELSFFMQFFNCRGTMVIYFCRLFFRGGVGRNVNSREIQAFGLLTP